MNRFFEVLLSPAPRWLEGLLWLICALLMAIILGVSLGCRSLPTLRNNVGTATNLQAVAEFDLNRACVFKAGAFVSGPAWCVPCLSALHRNQEARDLALASTKIPGKAPWQKKRLKETAKAVETACPSVNQ